MKRAVKSFAAVGAWLCVTVVSAAVLERYPLDEDTVVQWKLPAKLREVSGLVAHEGRLYAHGDEEAIVYQLDYEAGRLVKAFALGKPTLRGDFEGIAIVDERFYLVTSAGTLYEFAEGANGERVSYARHETGLGARCEVEGLAYDAANRDLLLACKQPRSRALRGRIAVFAWSVDHAELAPARHLVLPRKSVTKRLRADDFNPSGVEVDAASGNLLLIAARQRGIAEVARDGRVVSAQRLPRASLHRQAEGIAVLPDGRLVIADEGGSKRARLALYRPRT